MTPKSEFDGSARGRPPDPGSPGSEPEPTFADVLNGFSFDSGRRRRKHEQPEETEQQPGERAAPRPENAHVLGDHEEWLWPERDGDAGYAAGHTSDEIASGPGTFGEVRHPVDELADAAAIVRPYAWTRGRTKASVYLRMETLVSTSEQGSDIRGLGQLEHRAVAELCRYPHAVAEVAAKLSVPLGVARVLLSDMAELGLIIVHQAVAEDDDTAAQLVLMERVLSGLRRL